MKRLLVGIALFAGALVICALVVVWLYFPDFVAERRAVPWQYMWIFAEDENGVATIHCDAFRVAFEGHSFGDRSGSGNYVVDGRDGFRIFAGPESESNKMAGGVSYQYSQRQRVVAIDYQGHEIRYFHAQNKMSVDGADHATTAGQLRLLVTKGGAIEVVP